MGLFEELEKEMSNEEPTKTEGFAHTITRAMLGDEAVERNKVQVELKRKRQATLDRLGFYAGVILILCLVAVIGGGTVALLMWWF